MSPYFRSSYVFLPNLRFIDSSYFGHEAFMHHPLHALNASGSRGHSLSRRNRNSRTL